MSLSPSGSPAPIPIIDTIAPLADATVAWLVDIWGVMHDGVRPFAEACDACTRFRENSGLIVLVSNSPRPHEAVAAQLDRVGVPRACWDVIVSSGDVARSLIASYAGRAVLHIGPERDLPIFAGMDVERVKSDQADVVVCTGLFDDERETPDDYAELLASCMVRGLPMICANPDITVERGGRIIFCAGAIARAYEGLGGKVAYAGKPYLPIYERAFDTLESLRPGSADGSRLLAIGDGVHTDIAGAAAANLKSIFVASGVHVARPLSGEALEGLFPLPGPRPIAAMTRLSW
jgi:HAD superfamily hydrolase (TIGR01459 family)